MVDPLALARTFLDTFDKSAVDLFRPWLARHSATTKWIIGADFALRDKKHPGDCFAFTLIPYDVFPEEFAAEVRSMLPRDLKNSQSLPPNAATWLRDPRHGSQPVKLEVDSYYNAVRPQAGNETWLLQLRLTLLFPT
jgi:hypothetical protein